MANLIARQAFPEPKFHLGKRILKTDALTHLIGHHFGNLLAGIIAARAIQRIGNELMMLAQHRLNRSNRFRRQRQILRASDTIINVPRRGTRMD